MDGELVLLVRRRFDGTIERDWMPSILAVAECGYHSDNGSLYEAAWIVADDVDMGMWDRSA
jgi:hypothetical protein